MGQTRDITGKRFGKLTVLRKDETYIGKYDTKFICQCDCGTIISAFRSAIVSGHTKSCGCARKGVNKTHGMTKTPIYGIWVNMKNRCRNEHVKAYEYYGGKGIRVCDEWSNDFDRFYSWALQNGYEPGKTIDRIDNNGDYCPENCRWVLQIDQARNKTNTTFIEYNGEMRCLAEVCSDIGFPYKTAHRRLQRGKEKGKTLTADELFRPIEEKKISKRYRK